MWRSKFHRFGSLVTSLIVLSCISHDAEARPYINQVLTEGSRWAMNLDGEAATLTLLRGKGGKLQNGGYGVAYRIDFGGQQGSLRGIANASNTTQRVTFVITRHNGSKIRCEGFIAHESNKDKVMAGSCGDKNRQGAWYATHQTTIAPLQTGMRKKNAVNTSFGQKCDKDLKQTLWQQKQLRSKLNIYEKKFRLCLTKYNKLYKGSNKTLKLTSSNTSLVSLSSIKEMVGGNHNGEKAAAPTAVFPTNTQERDPQIRQWLKGIDENLLDTLRIGFNNTGSSLSDYSNFEASRCPENHANPVDQDICQIAYRQLFVYLMLGG